MTYIVKHWRGELSLATSFWINTVGLNVIFRAVEALLSETSLVDDSVLTAQIILVSTFVHTVVVYPWQMIGLWHSAHNHIKNTQNATWPNVVKVLVVISIIGTIGNLMTNHEHHKNLWRIAVSNSAKPLD
ncbi:hypothetical protein [Echinimonas agarilytica]|uniref:Uncharacterized protein n=1 Tax=Echinimonas agarilytica TaxID=1215918 RepID=A0AA41W4A9_9GAMM|nr:hypothetical protein [Echinimonas agarilytica]MCM2678649.1 hypothetical protein [Echinimonas agarilytica]